MKYATTIVFCLLSLMVYSQYDLVGKVTNGLGEKLEGASVFVLGSHDHATVSDHEGWFDLSGIDQSVIELKVTYIGYEDYSMSVDLTQTEYLDVVLSGSIFQLDQIEIDANKLSLESPFSYISMAKEEIELRNLGQDMPYIVQHTPNVVVNSDAGAGIGYTSMRVRGVDGTRINVTINGVPLNDAESHGVFWVDLPDLSSSTDEIQLQRGVGPSTNGAGAFGATMNLNTNQVRQNPYVKMSGTYGSFNTSKANITLSTGLMNNLYLLEGRYSVINSDGYIDRASSDLDSWYFSAARIKKQQSIRFNAFSGKERTYQAWNGVPAARVDGTPDELLEHYLNNSNGDYNTVADSINLFDSGRTYNAYTYPNQVDDYRQAHYQLHYAVQPADEFVLKATAHLTKGKGFFEQFRYQDDLVFYGIIDTMITRSDLVRRRWLDNDFYGLIMNAVITPIDPLKVSIGGGYNVYDGDHFGEVVQVTDVTLAEIENYYESNGTKSDLNAYLRFDYNLSQKLALFGDLQYRALVYESTGTDNDRLPFQIDTSYSFFNPKFGLNYRLNDNTSVYGSYAKAHREPVRSDFLDAIGTAVPAPESLDDYELGLRSRLTDDLALTANVYYMDYKDQLVLTGAVNDVGAAVRTNVPRSYRTGLELATEYQLTYDLDWNLNVSLSRNKISRFTEKVLEYTATEVLVRETEYEDTDLAFSPSIVVGSQVNYKLFSGMTISLLSKYVGRQFLDNTATASKSLDPYLVNDLLAKYTLNTDLIQEIELKFMLNNFLDTKYSSNGYTYSYIVGDRITENYLYPQAGINFLVGASITF